MYEHVRDKIKGINELLIEIKALLVKQNIDQNHPESRSTLIDDKCCNRSKSRVLYFKLSPSMLLISS